MAINPSEITKLLKDQIKNFGEKAEVSEIGKVLSVGDGIARVYGLDNVQAGEMVEFEDGSKGMALNLENDSRIVLNCIFFIFQKKNSNKTIFKCCFSFTKGTLSWTKIISSLKK